MPARRAPPQRARASRAAPPLTFFGQIWMKIIPILITSALGGIVTLFVFQVSGSQTIAEHSKHLDNVETRFAAEKAERDKRIEELAAHLGDIKRTDEDRRNVIRDEFLKENRATSSGIAELNQKMAVSDTVTKQMLAQLEKLNMSFEAIRSLALAPPSRR